MLKPQELRDQLRKEIMGQERAVAVNCTELKNAHGRRKNSWELRRVPSVMSKQFLTPEKIARKFTIIIFEQLEKADCAPCDLLLQILERGELTTGRGVDLNFRNCFILMTSNVCAKEVDSITKNAVIGFGPSEIRGAGS